MQHSLSLPTLSLKEPISLHTLIQKHLNYEGLILIRIESGSEADGQSADCQFFPCTNVEELVAILEQDKSLQHEHHNEDLNTFADLSHYIFTIGSGREPHHRVISECFIRGVQKGMLEDIYIKLYREEEPLCGS